MRQTERQRRTDKQIDRQAEANTGKQRQIETDGDRLINGDKSDRQTSKRLEKQETERTN